MFSAMDMSLNYLEGEKTALKHQSRSIEIQDDHIIAVGGAGSLGSPALVSGRKIIKAASSPSTTIPARYRGSPNIWGGCFGGAHTDARKAAHNSPMRASPAMSPEAVSTPA